MRFLFLVVFPLCAQTRLEDLERIALAANPSIAQAEAAIRSAEGRARQASLYPNPVVGTSGEHVTPALNGGSIGGYLEQRIVLGGKLRYSKLAGEMERATAVQMQGAARLELLISIRSLFYRGLGEQRLLDVRREMYELTRRTAATVGELKNIGQSDGPDLLTAEIEMQRAELAVTLAHNALDRTMREISAVAKQPVTGPLEGLLEALPTVNSGGALSGILAKSPEVHIASINLAKAASEVKRARAERIPDITVLGGVRNNSEPIDKLSGLPRPVGNEGVFNVSIQLPIFNRNQGAIAAARAEQERASLGTERVRMDLERRFAAVYNEYASSAEAAARYRDEMIPRAQQALELYVSGFRQMASAYPKVLAAQRNLIQLQDDYISQMITAWRAWVEIDGLLAGQ